MILDSAVWFLAGALLFVGAALVYAAQVADRATRGFLEYLNRPEPPTLELPKEARGFTAPDGDRWERVSNGNGGSFRNWGKP